MRQAVRFALEDAEDIEVVGEARVGSQVLPLVRSTRPDVVLLDMRMPEMDGLTCLERIRKYHPEVKVVMLSAVDEPEQVNAALERGASGYMLKTVRPGDLAAAVRDAVAGRAPDPLHLRDGDQNEAARTAGLSEKELEVLRELARGRSNREIAKELFISEQTVKFHLRNIYRKLGASSRTEALRVAYQHNVIESPLYSG